MAEERIQENKIDRVRRLLDSPHAHIKALLSVLHPTEIAKILEEAPPEIQIKIIRQLPKDVVSEAITEMDDDANPGKLLTLIKPETASKLIEELDLDDAVDLLAQLPEGFKERILSFIPDEEGTIINQLLNYREDTAGGLMNPAVIKVRKEMKKLDALREVVEQSEEIDDFYTIYVVDERNHLLGYVSVKNLFQARNSESIENIMETDLIKVQVNEDQEEVAKRMSQYNLPTLPVVDYANRLLGRITFDDILDVLEDETTEDILNFAGVSEDENLRGDSINSVKSRLPWLLVNLTTAFIASAVLKTFEQVITEMAVLASFMPIIAGVAGNGATQTLAVTIRRISTNGIPARKALNVIGKEMLVGLMNGLTLGLLVALIAYLRGDGYMIGAVVCVALFCNLILAGMMGSFIPIALERLKVDPAVASSIFITAFTDIIGYILLFSLASYVLL